MKPIEEQLQTKTSFIVGVFCFFAAERLLPIYEAFAQRFSIPPDDFKSVVNKAFELLFLPDEYKLEELKDNLEKVIPDSEDYSDVLADQAQCATICMMYVLEYLTGHDLSMAGYALQKLDESIDIYGYESGDEKSISSKEVKWQDQLLVRLEAGTAVNRLEVEKLRHLNKGYAIPAV